MREDFDIIAQLAPNETTNWVPLFPCDNFPWKGGVRPIIFEIEIANILTAQIKYSIAYGIFATLPDFDDLPDDLIRRNEIPIDANDSRTIHVKYPFNDDGYQIFVKCDTASGMTVLAVGTKRLG